MSRLAALLMVFAAVACAKVDVVHFANGNPGYLVHCVDATGSLTRCYRQAGETCGPLGYRLYDWQGHQLPMEEAQALFDEQPPELTSSPLETRQILIGCLPRS